MASELVPEKEAKLTDNYLTEKCLEADLEIQLDAATVPGKGLQLEGCYLKRSSDQSLVMTCSDNKLVRQMMASE